MNEQRRISLSNGMIVWKSTTIAAIILVVLSCNPHGSGRMDIEQQTTLRKDALISTLSQYSSNLKKNSAAAEATRSLEDSAKVYQDMTCHLLDETARLAYEKEREAFMAWYSFQDSVSWGAVSDIWDMFVGGTAGAALCTSYLYDIANVNNTEQLILYGALSKRLFATQSGKSATIEELRRTKELVVDELKRWDSIVEKDSYQREYVANSPDQITAILEEDIKLFQQWISERNRLERYLPKRVQSLFSSCTDYWVYVRVMCYSKGMIHERGFLS